jgi:hypothetical protein
MRPLMLSMNAAVSELLGCSTTFRRSLVTEDYGGASIAVQ